MELKILDTDKFFTDSPNTGEPGCECSRCHKAIKDGEKIMRIAVDEKQVFAKNNKTNQAVTLEDKVHLGGYEYRLCEKCCVELKVKPTE